MITDAFYETMLLRYIDKVPELKHIDRYKHQYDQPEVDNDGNPVFDAWNCPALFFQFPPAFELSPLGMRRKSATIVFSVHIMQKVIQDMQKRTSPAQRAKAYEHKQLVDKVQLFTEGFNGEQVVAGYNQFDSISWIGMNPDIFMGAYIIDILHFRVKLISDNSLIKYTKTTELVPPFTPNDILNNDMILFPEQL